MAKLEAMQGRAIEHRKTENKSEPPKETETKSEKDNKTESKTKVMPRRLQRNLLNDSCVSWVWWYSLVPWEQS